MRPTHSARAQGQPQAQRLAGRLSQAIARTLLANWQQKGAVASLLLPAALLYRALVSLRRGLYQLGVFKPRRVSIPVIVVGNVISGGAGKTPTTIAIVQHLQAKGRAVGVVSRGYGRKETAYARVQATSTPEQVGDEPLLIFRTTGAPVSVGPSRYLASQSLLHEQPELQVLVCDDGLQHYGLHRDVEICVFDNRGCGNGWLLPAGPLREPWPRKLLSSAGQSPKSTLVLHTGTHPAFGGFRAHRSLAGFALSQSGKSFDLTALSAQSRKPLFAVAGIAQPEVFFDMLRALNVPLAGTLGLADHTDFETLDPQLAISHTLLCTEKDAEKLWRVAPDALAIPLQQTMEPAFFDALDRLLEPHSGA